MINFDASPQLLVGDLLLLTGMHSASLVKAQQLLIPTTISSHIAIAHGECVCIDAIPKDGVRNRFLLDVIENIKPDWRVIRKKGLTGEEHDALQKSAAYFLGQSYLIKPIDKIGSTKSYCSELARKIYAKANIPINVPEKNLVIPGHFDLLHQNSGEWLDVTKNIVTWLQEVRINEKEFRAVTQTMKLGFKLNKKRYRDREKMRQVARKQHQNGAISDKFLEKQLEIINDIERNMHFNFWDTEKNN